MEINNEQNEIRLTIPLETPSRESQNGAKPKGFRAKQLGAVAVAFREPFDSAAMEVYLTSLADLTDHQFQIATSLAIRELTFFPKVAELRKLAAVGRDELQDAEARKAWDLLTRYVKKYVSNDVHGNYGPEHGWYPNYPKLAERILDTVRRTGGWKVYACMDADDMPFIQKRFFEEYQAWTAVERIIDNSRLIEEIPEVKQLVAAHPTGPTKQAEPKPETGPAFRAKPMPSPLTPIQIQDRREMLRQQAELLMKK